MTQGHTVNMLIAQGDSDEPTHYAQRSGGRDGRRRVAAHGGARRRRPPAPGHHRAHKVHTPDGRHTGRHCGPGHSSDQAHGRVVTPNDMPLTARSGPSSAYRKIDKVRDGRILGLACKKNGTKVLGDARWYKLAGHRDYVFAHYVRTFRPVPWC